MVSLHHSLRLRMFNWTKSPEYKYVTGGVTLLPTERQYGNMVIKYDLISQPTWRPIPSYAQNPTGLQHGTSCMIRSLRSFQFRMEVEDIWEQNTLKSKIHEQRLREIMSHANCETVTELNMSFQITFLSAMVRNCLFFCDRPFR